MSFPRIGQFKDPAALRDRLREMNVDIPLDDTILTAAQNSPLAAPIAVGGIQVGNRWCIHPMEGWDGTRDGNPTEHTLRRWRHFGISGAKLIWGGEAAAVQPDGRANPNQLLALAANRAGLAALLDATTAAHRERFGSTDDLLVGLQLTHSGRFCRPHDKRLEPRIAYHHPLLDAKFGIDPHNPYVVWTDDDLERLVERYVAAARLAGEISFRFVDIKACHGYLLHEFLSARSRPGRFGGDLAGRARLLTTIVGRIRAALPELLVGVRLSFFDLVPFQAGTEHGEPMPFEKLLPYQLAFGADPGNPLEFDLTEPIELLKMLRELGVTLVNLSCGSAYYNPHIMRPATFPPSDGYLPPEDPLVGVARQLRAVRLCKQAIPDLPLVGTGYSYLQDYLPHVAQAAVREGWTDFVGLGRVVLSYPELPTDVLTTGKLARKKVCRTFSDCTTAPRNGLVSGCFPLDPYYKALPEAERLKALKDQIM